jgi:hypothetical protein
VARIVVVLVALVYAFPASAQQNPTAAANPLDALKTELVRVLADASLPFSAEQDREITLMIEERRQSSETLFGGLMDFRTGPTSGQDAERLQSAIGWMRNEFLTRIPSYLTEQQAAVWTKFVATGPPSIPGQGAAGQAAPRQQTQFVRINNNRFTAEDLTYQGGRGGGGFGGGGGGGNAGRGGGAQETEVIERGGAGAWHGNFQHLLKDDALNARNVFAENKPPYQEHRLNVDVGGPLIPGRLSTNVTVSYSLAQNVDTINALLPEGPFTLGITRPTVNRAVTSRSTYQVSDANSLAVNTRYATNTNKDEGIGGFTLRERASNRNGANGNVELRQFTALASGLVETRVNVSVNRSETTPFSNAVRVNVSDTFNAGGAQNQSDERTRNLDFGGMYTRLGQRLTLKAGTEGTHRTNREISTSNFGGTYSFSNLDDYLARTATTFRIARGEPLLEVSQLEMSGFLQSDLAINRQLTLMFGARYDAQTNLADYNNVSPRFGFAYGAGRGVVLRGGAGIFAERLPIDRVATQMRFDGRRQYEIVIDKPIYPDPFSGVVRGTLPSIRVTDPDLRAQYNYVTMASVEKTFWRTLLLTAAYDYVNNKNRMVMRDRNQPFDRTVTGRRVACTLATSALDCIRPDPTQGSVLNLESTSFQRTHTVRLTSRHRFSVFNVTGGYTYQNGFEDNTDYGTSSNSYDPRADWSTRGMPKHTWNTSINARLPLGIFLTETLTGNTGRFYSITTGEDDNQDGVTNDRPPGVGRNSATGPGRFNVDVNFSKAFFLGAAGSAGVRKNVNMFLNVTNLLNRIHYASPSGVMSSKNFGKITSASDPREVEAGLRFQF